MRSYISKLVNKFLAWPVPVTCHPDGTNGDPNRIGTNLLSADEARQMFEHCLPPMPKNGYATEAEGDAYTQGWFDGNEADKYGLPRYRHRARGTHYTVIGEAFLASWKPAAEGERLVVYRGDDGALWARQHSEFHDGRFEQITVGSAVPDGVRTTSEASSAPRSTSNGGATDEP